MEGWKSMEFDMAKFEEKKKGLLELGKKKEEDDGCTDDFCTVGTTV